MIATTS